MARSVNWLAPDGNTPDAIVGVLADHVEHLITLGGNIHSASDMPGGWDNSALESSSSFFASLVDLDPRGGFFDQPDMDNGIMCAVWSKNAAERWSAMNYDIGEVAYKVRVMLIHVRPDNNTFVAVSDGLRSAVDAIDARNLKPIGQSTRPNPFLLLREELPDEGDKLPKVAYRNWNGYAAIAFDEDGGSYNVDTYFESGGFAVARWHRYGCEDMLLKVPGTWARNCRIDVPAPTPKQKQKAKAKASGTNTGRHQEWPYQQEAAGGWGKLPMEEEAEASHVEGDEEHGKGDFPEMVEANEDQYETGCSTVGAESRAQCKAHGAKTAEEYGRRGQGAGRRGG